jgi:ABC-2 type transport system ATP-binding protein
MSQASPDLAIRCRDLHKIYKTRKDSVHAVKGLNLEVLPGECFGLLGPNGAGKTTTMNVLLGFVPPTSGNAFLFGVNVREPIARQRIGYLPELTYYYKFLTVEERHLISPTIVNLFRASFARQVSSARQPASPCSARRGPEKFYSKLYLMI